MMTSMLLRKKERDGVRKLLRTLPRINNRRLYNFTIMMELAIPEYVIKIKTLISLKI